eukprot:172519-Rhodomonas_salina.1
MRWPREGCLRSQTLTAQVSGVCARAECAVPGAEAVCVAAGFIDVEELRATLSSWGLEVGSEEAARMVEAASTSGCPELDFSE